MKKFFIPLLALLLLSGFYFTHEPKRISTITSSEQALALLKEQFPEFQSYPASNLPPKSVEVINTEDGWRIGMYVEGSGVRGILKANCFLVTKTGVVTETGLFQGEGPARSINLLTCTPKE